MDQVDHLDLRFRAEGVVSLTDDLLVKNIFHVLAFNLGNGTNEFVHPDERDLVPNIYPRHYRVDPFQVELVKVKPHLIQQLVPRHLEIVLVVRVVHVSLRVALIIAHLHLVLENWVFTNRLAIRLVARSTADFGAYATVQWMPPFFSHSRAFTNASIHGVTSCLRRANG